MDQAGFPPDPFCCLLPGDDALRRYRMSVYTIDRLSLSGVRHDACQPACAVVPIRRGVRHAPAVFLKRTGRSRRRRIYGASRLGDETMGERRQHRVGRCTLRRVYLPHGCHVPRSRADGIPLSKSVRTVSAVARLLTKSIKEEFES